MIDFIYQPGMAHVKPEFIIESFKNKTFKTEKTEIQNDGIITELVELNNKNIKTKGMNKKRQHSHINYDKNDGNNKKICPYIKSSNDCPYGEKCLYEHNVNKALTTKTKSLPGDCYNYKVKGYCQMGFMCLFSESHTNEVGENMKNTEVFDSYIPVNNVMSVEFKDVLRKKKYNFDKSYLLLDKMKIHYKNKFIIHNSNDETEDFEIEKREKKVIDFTDKLYLAPLTTVGNLPFRRICKEFGADITCSEMAMANKLLQGIQSEWALLKRHSSEDLFGVQLCGSYPDSLTKCAQLISENCQVDFLDLNCGCPIDLVCNKGEGCGLLRNNRRLESIVAGVSSIIDYPMTIKCRIGYNLKEKTTHLLLPKLRDIGISLATVHGRTREQRYNNNADWDYISQCVKAASPMPVFGNGDILSFEDYLSNKDRTGVSGVMIARGALIKPWIFTEIKQQKTLDISSGERFDILKKFTNYGLEYWGSDLRGVENTRRFLLEWLSFLCRYIPVGLLECLPQRVNLRPPPYFGRDDLETLMASANCADWIKISEMLLGPVPDGFNFTPKHRASSYA